MIKLSPAQLLAKLRKAIRKAAIKSGAARVRAEYRIGKIMKHFPAGMYGVRECAKHVGVKKERLYHCRKFAAKYSAKELTELLKKAPNATFSHVVALMSVPSEKRTQFEEMLGKSGITVEELRATIQEQVVLTRRGGRLVDLKLSGEAAFRRLVIDLSRLTKRWECRKGLIEKHLNSEPPESFKEVIGKFEKAADEIKALDKGRKRQQPRRKSSRGLN